MPETGSIQLPEPKNTKAGFDPNQPRNANGEWGDGGTSKPKQGNIFKDSVVRDDDGNLKTVYHVTNFDFDKFDPKMGAQGVIWFTETKDKILNGETGASTRFGQTKYIFEAYLNIKKMAGWDEYEKYGLGEIEEMGFDGIKLDDDYVVFESNQIKIINKSIL